MTDNNTTFPLRLSRSIRKALERVAKEDGVSMNQFISVAVAEKLSAIDTARYFEERRDRADMSAFRRIMNRTGGEPPRPGDELPS